MCWVGVCASESIFSLFSEWQREKEILIDRLQSLVLRDISIKWVNYSPSSFFFLFSPPSFPIVLGPSHFPLLFFPSEYCLKAATSGGNTAIAVRGRNASVFITQKKVPVSFLICFVDLIVSQDRLIDPSSVTSIYRITDGIGCLMLGLLRE